MTRYLALLRGINVGTANRIRMDALKRLFENAGFYRVETLIQSGNVLFASPFAEEKTIRAITEALKTSAGIETAVVLRTAEEMKQLVGSSPFSVAEITEAQRFTPEIESFHVCLLPEAPAETALAKLASVSLEGDRYSVSGRDIYLLLPHGIRSSKLSIRLQRIFPDATLRNWNTISKLNERINAAEETNDV